MKKTIIALVLLSVLLFGCVKEQVIQINASPDTNTAGQNVGIANPASVYCVQQGGKLEIKTAEDGSQSGFCTLANGTVCEEWAYYRGICPETK